MKSNEEKKEEEKERAAAENECKWCLNELATTQSAARAAAAINWSLANRTL